MASLTTESYYVGLPGPGWYHISFQAPYLNTPFVVATVREAVLPPAGVISPPWTVYFRDIVLGTFDIVVQKGGAPVPPNRINVPAGNAGQNQPIYVYWQATGIR
jgi:hypothetical protein